MSTAVGSSDINFIINILDSRYYNNTARVTVKQRINSTNILTTKEQRKMYASKIVLHLG
jgi:hypothetical protein